MVTKTKGKRRVRKHPRVHVTRQKLHIVKRRGHLERFDERKVYASCYAACVVSGLPKLKAERICKRVTSEVKHWIHNKHSVSSDQILIKTAMEMRKLDRDAAFLYSTHRDIS